MTAVVVPVSIIVTLQFQEPIYYRRSHLITKPQTSYTICVKTTDLGGLTFRKQFAISILDSNDPPTNITLSNDSIAENLPVATLVGTINYNGY